MFDVIDFDKTGFLEEKCLVEHFKEVLQSYKKDHTSGHWNPASAAEIKLDNGLYALTDDRPKKQNTIGANQKPVAGTEEKKEGEKPAEGDKPSEKPAGGSNDM